MNPDWILLCDILWVNIKRWEEGEQGERLCALVHTKARRWFFPLFWWMIEQNFSADYLLNYRIRQEGTTGKSRSSQVNHLRHNGVAYGVCPGPISLSNKASPHRTAPRNANETALSFSLSLSLSHTHGPATQPYNDYFLNVSYFYFPPQCLSPRDQCWVDPTLHSQTPTVRCPPCPASPWRTIYLCK